MPELTFKQVDVFTRVPCLGNPVAVVFGADGLDPATMQRIAHWTNLSETVFFQKSSRADYRLRIFTPVAELKFAGHPTIGAAHAALESGLVAGPDFTQECGAGLISLQIHNGNIMLTVSDISHEPANFQSSDFTSDRLVLEEPLLVDCGPRWLVARVKDEASLTSVTIETGRLQKLERKYNATGLTLYAVKGPETIEVRSFAPSHGIVEDPVCGSGNASVAYHLDLLADTSIARNYTAHQGQCLGRDGRVKVVRGPGGIQIGGSSVTVIDGVLHV